MSGMDGSMYPVLDALERREALGRRHGVECLEREAVDAKGPGIDEW